MKFNIPMTHLQGAVLRIAVITGGSVVATCGDTVIAQFGEGSVEEQPITDMVLDVMLKYGSSLTVEIDANNIRANEYGDDVAIYHPSYRDMLNSEARMFAKTICTQTLSNDILDVVRAALTHARDEADALRAELEAEQARPKWNGKT